MDLKRKEIELARERWEKARKLSGDERVQEIKRVLRLLYPLVADTRGREVLETYTALKEKPETLKEAERLVEEILGELKF
ncbi:MAG: hypothetical protein GXN96_05405 [Aquificae bacterium]|nr:hypothetical protein [Aquificota bacterium]